MSCRVRWVQIAPIGEIHLCGSHENVIESKFAASRGPGEGTGCQSDNERFNY